MQQVYGPRVEIDLLTMLIAMIGQSRITTPVDSSMWSQQSHHTTNLPQYCLFCAKVDTAQAKSHIEKYVAFKLLNSTLDVGLIKGRVNSSQIGYASFKRIGAAAHIQH